MNGLIINLIIFFSVNVSSNNGRYHASVRYQGGTELITESLTLYDRYNNVVYTKNNIAVNTFFISDDGNVFALDEHRLYFYRLDGSEMILKELSYPNGFGFSPDITVFYASDREGLFAYSDEGNLVCTYSPGRLFASTANGESVVVISADTLFVYENGGLTDTEFLTSPYARDVYFSGDAKSVVIQIQGSTKIYDTRNRAWVKQK